jgi:hypothetical protein
VRYERKSPETVPKMQTHRLERKVKTAFTITRYDPFMEADVAFAVTVSYDVSGSFRPAQRDVSPAEQPEISIESVTDRNGKQFALSISEWSRLYTQLEKEAKQRQEDFV